MTGAGPPGIDLPALQRFFDEHVAESDGTLRVELISGGRSNLTYLVTDGPHRWVLRRPPLGGLTPSAHDMRREFRVVEALYGSSVPVARPVVYAADPSIIGASFAVVAHVPGVVLRSQADIAHLSTSDLVAISGSVVAAMAELHRIDPASVGLADFGRPEGYLRRQINRWTDQWSRIASAPVPDVDRLAGRLAEACPADSASAIVHGDLRIDNTILDSTDLTKVRALLDWEMATLGDPLADLALHLVYRDPAFAPVLGGSAASTDPRMPSPRQLVQLYTEKSGRPVDRIQFHLALAYFKSAVIAAGIHARHRDGLAIGDGLDEVGTAVPALAAAGVAALGRGAP